MALFCRCSFFLRVLFSFWWFLSCGGLSLILFLSKYVFVICCWLMSSICPLFAFFQQAIRLGVHCGGGAAPPHPLPLILREIKATKQPRKVYYLGMTASSSKFDPQTDMTSYARYTSTNFDRTPESIPQCERILFPASIPFLNHAGVNLEKEFREGKCNSKACLSWATRGKV